MATGSSASGSSADISSGAESSTSSSTSGSMLDRLKAPTLADTARKRKVKSNPPPTGKRKCRGSLPYVTGYRKRAHFAQELIFRISS